MGVNITIGQYVAGTSIVHRIDARVKIVLVIAYAVALFLSTGWIGIGICGALGALGYAAANVPAKLAVRGLKPVLCILLFTVALNAFTFSAVSNDGAPASAGTIALAGTFGISLQGTENGIFFALRIVFLIAATSLLTYTTPLIDIVDAIRSLLSPLSRLKVPVEDVAVVCALTLRFIPSTVEEADRIMRAQKARGLRFDEGSLLTRAKAWVPIITPLFINLFRRSDTLASAMDARCYTGAARTHLRTLRMRRTDSLAGALGVALLACVAAFL